jgi:DNA-binding CsgD family transcriptional regulator
LVRHENNSSEADPEAAVTAKRVEAGPTYRVPVPPVSADRISALHLTFRELHTQRHKLLSSLRVLMDETLSHGERLRDEWQRGTTGAGAPSGRFPVNHGMTPREAEVASLLADGLSNTAVARRLGISPHTARHHTQRVLGKLGVHSRAEAGARLRLR